MNKKYIEINPGYNPNMINAWTFLNKLEDVLWVEAADNYYEPQNWEDADDYLLIYGDDIKLLRNVIKLCEKGFKESVNDAYKRYYTNMIKLISDRIEVIVEASLL